MEKIEGTSLFYESETRTLYKDNPNGEPEAIIKDCKYFKYPVIGLKVFKVQTIDDCKIVKVGFVLNSGIVVSGCMYDDIVMSSDERKPYGIKNGVFEEIPI